MLSCMNTWNESVVTCPTCKGANPARSTCWACHARGVVREDDYFSVATPDEVRRFTAQFADPDAAMRDWMSAL